MEKPQRWRASIALRFGWGGQNPNLGNNSLREMTSMSNDLGRIQTKRKTDCERVTCGGTDLGFDLLGFWQWSGSDLVSNATRGVLAEYAEYMVARALGIDTVGVRDEWAAHTHLLLASAFQIADSRFENEAPRNRRTILNT